MLVGFLTLFKREGKSIADMRLSDVYKTAILESAGLIRGGGGGGWWQR